ncbi:RyR domain-containing protein [Evansella sp. AB-P1]|uniref:RyR domain-containing protein n=1 Tax=Evansella sp. AB-P1 TaxID=3037653 RepID=UPI00241DAE10|nr:RyR domain-containing protein [Evansella sp. AB-P1]MDG5788528.1 RyR domain-containing protein [Evansella sp. AB-P1]
MTYKPNPIDTSNINLSKEIKNVTEVLAKNILENWSAQRISDGWQYGPKRDDIRKEHPSLVPYDKLSESEKDYDQITVTETIKTLIALGYTIKK